VADALFVSSRTSTKCAGASGARFTDNLVSFVVSLDATILMKVLSVSYHAAWAPSDRAADKLVVGDITLASLISR